MVVLSLQPVQFSTPKHMLLCRPGSTGYPIRCGIAKPSAEPAPVGQETKYSEKVYIMERRNNESKASVTSDQVLMRMASRREDEIHDKLSKIQKASTSRPNPTVVAGRPTGEHASMTVNPGKARSMFLVVSFCEGRYKEAIYEVKFKRRCTGEVFDDDMGREAAPLLEPLAKFSNMYFLQSASISSKIYLLQQDTHDESSWPSPARSLGGYVFDTETRAVIPSIPPTIATKPMANVVSANGKLYYLAFPHWSRYPDDPCFERYDSNLEVWEPMPPFPSYAVCYGVILFSLCQHVQLEFQSPCFS
ncbi:hypothetical protein PRUPE_5G121900 [Prunus persica]|uniref:Uncharacterized protein n=1 Tax=Prunus persica TaxID=3760 RepID=A0A251P7A4_PRUPE|nr:hypothetical protein PRUPE_5G121900 [Prunus persica]